MLITHSVLCAIQIRGWRLWAKIYSNISQNYIEERWKSEEISRTDENLLLGQHNLPTVKLEQYEGGDFLDQGDFLSYRTDSEEIDRYVQGDFLGPWEYNMPLDQHN